MTTKRRTVLVTGGTRGIGWACALAFARRGDRVYVTHKWGSVTPEEIERRAAEAGIEPPVVLDADAASEEDTRAALGTIREREGHLDVVISNVAFAPRVRSLDDLTRRGLQAAIDYSAWPLVLLARESRHVFGRPPRHLVAISSEGADSYHVDYDAVAAAKAALEALVRYLGSRLLAEDCRVNAVRTRFVRTAALRATFGDAFEPFVDEVAPGSFTAPEVVAEAVAGLCGGGLDAVAGQILTVDGGAGLADNFARITAAPASQSAAMLHSPSPGHRTVLVTGGTRGIGLETALAFARTGARLWLTYGFGGHDEAALAARFAAVGAEPPTIVQCDAGRATDTTALLDRLADETDGVDVLVSNVSSALVVREVADYSERAFLRSLRASAFATAEYTLGLGARLGRYPGHVVVMSSDGPDRFLPGYDLVACSKAVVETLVRYLAVHLGPHGVRINALRSRAVRTDSLDQTFGAAFHRRVAEALPPERAVDATDVAAAALALCGGDFDGMTGQVLTVDRGTAFLDGVSYLYARSRAGGAA